MSQDSFLSHYLSYSECNESPKEYHTWAALSTLSHLIGPRVWTYMGGHLNWFPNLYVFLVGRPGSMKTTSMRQAQKLIQNFPAIAHAPTSASKEAIVEMMKGDDSPCHGTYIHEGKKISYKQLAVFASEFVSLLNASGNAPGMIEFLTEIWDSTGQQYWEYFKKSKTLLANPYFSLCVCLTPSTLQSLVNSKVIGNGMSRRCLFIVHNGFGKPRYRIFVTEEQSASWQWCIDHGRKVQQLTGPFTWEPEADALHKAWYDAFKPTIADVESEVLQNFYMTKQEYVIKLSMLLALAEPEPKLIHTQANFAKALDLVTRVEKGACELFDSTGRNELASITSEVELFLKERPGKPLSVKRDLLTRFWKQLKDPRELDAILDHLSRIGKVKGEDRTIQTGTGAHTEKIVTYIG
jgi:hypothetical protein